MLLIISTSAFFIALLLKRKVRNTFLSFYSLPVDGLAFWLRHSHIYNIVTVLLSGYIPRSLSLIWTIDGSGGIGLKYDFSKLLSSLKLEEATYFSFLTSLSLKMYQDFFPHIKKEEKCFEDEQAEVIVKGYDNYGVSIIKDNWIRTVSR